MKEKKSRNYCKSQPKTVQTKQIDKHGLRLHTLREPGNFRPGRPPVKHHFYFKFEQGIDRLFTPTVKTDPLFASMKYWYQNPHSSLSEYVRTVLIVEGFSEANPDALPFFTNGMPALFCRTERNGEDIESIGQLSLFGRTTTADNWTTRESTTIIACFFKPFALATLFNIPAAKLTDTPIELSNWDPHKNNALKTQLSYAASTARKTEILENLLIQQLLQNKKDCGIVKYATDQIMYNTGTEILSDLLKELKLNERTFQRIFKKYVGVTPVQYRRICQFQLSFSQLRAKKFNKLTDIAYDNGFADQSHFIRSFREFTQTTPNDYLRFGLREKEE